MEVRYYICKHCGNIVEKVKDKGVPEMCIRDSCISAWVSIRWTCLENHFRDVGLKEKYG